MIETFHWNLLYYYYKIKERRLRQAVELLQKHAFEFDEESIAQHLEGNSSSSPSLNHHQPDYRLSMGSDTSIVIEEGFEKSVLFDELQCVGLNPHFQTEWAMTVLKILSYPELISPDYK